MKNNNCDICYGLNTTSCFCVTATTEKQARLKALEQLENMSRKELLECFAAALDYERNFRIVDVELIDTAEDDDMSEDETEY